MSIWGFFEASTSLFQQKQCPSNESKFSRQWKKQPSNASPWTERSPYLNIIENIWAIMDLMEYFGGKYYETVRDVQFAVKEVWECVKSD